MATIFKNLRPVIQPFSPVHLGRFGEGLGDLAVPSSVAGGDEVGDAAALQEGGGAHLAFAEQLGERDHLHQPQPDHRRLGVVSETEAVAESGTYCHDVLTYMLLLINTFNEE